MDELSRALLQIIVTLVSVIGTLVATFRFYLPRRDRNRHSNPGHNPGHNPGDNAADEELLRMFRDFSQANVEHHVREEQQWQEWTRTFQRIEAKRP
ncbi:hypothetical protein LCGC14_0744420 [marine sediment metagenome]|uniref:Uncharacterized protein n=1 Tax=marine sediment metagenome TaxID=412755 RepID=A0A0F9QQW1_9ZZZZ